MKGVPLTDKKRKHILDVYYSEEGYRAAKPLAIQYGIAPRHIATLARENGTAGYAARIELAKQSVTAMLAEFRVGREDLLRSKYKDHSRLRSIAIIRLHDAGFRDTTIAAAMGLNTSSVRYWVNAPYQAKIRKRNKANQAAKRREMGITQKIPSEQIPDSQLGDAA